MAPDVSRTFHGRDIFAPAAAHLACGVPAARFGKPISDYICIADTKPSKLSANCWRGTIFRADRFGNLITNFHLDDFARITRGPFELRVGAERIRRLALTFSEAAIGELVAVFGSSDYLEIVANQSSAAQILGCGAALPRRAGNLLTSRDQRERLQKTPVWRGFHRKLPVTVKTP